MKYIRTIIYLSFAISAQYALAITIPKDLETATGPDLTEFLKKNHPGLVKHQNNPGLVKHQNNRGTLGMPPGVGEVLVTGPRKDSYYVDKNGNKRHDRNIEWEVKIKRDEAKMKKKIERQRIERQRAERKKHNRKTESLNDGEYNYLGHFYRHNDTMIENSVFISPSTTSNYNGRNDDYLLYNE